MIQPQLPTSLEILFEDSALIAVEKPSGLLTHRLPGRVPREPTAIALLRDQINNFVYPLHRLDRATSGVLVFAKSFEAASLMGTKVREGQWRKSYQAVVRGWVHTDDAASPWSIVDRPLRKSDGHDKVPAQTHYRVLERVEFPHALGPHSTVRYTLLELEPQQGRYHQIRKHMNSISHPILGDTVYGDGRHNRLAREKWGFHRLALWAHRVEFEHPFESGRRIVIESKHPQPGDLPWA